MSNAVINSVHPIAVGRGGSGLYVKSLTVALFCVFKYSDIINISQTCFSFPAVNVGDKVVLTRFQSSSFKFISMIVNTSSVLVGKISWKVKHTSIVTTFLLYDVHTTMTMTMKMNMFYCYVIYTLQQIKHTVFIISDIIGNIIHQVNSLGKRD